MTFEKRWVGIIACGVGGLVNQGAQAEGFIEDSKANLLLRNFYVNADNRSGTAKPSRQEEWGQGFVLDFRSGLTPGPIGFGVDALGMLGVRLDSGKGRHYNANSDNFNGVIFPTDHGGRAVDDFSSLGLTAKAAIAKSELRYGTLAPQLPILISSDRLVLQTFTGAQVESRDIDRLTLTLGQLEHAKGRGSSNEQGLSMSGANNARTGVTSNKFYYGGGIYKPRADWTLQYYYANLQDFYRQHFFGLKHSLPVGPGQLTADFRYFRSLDDGKDKYDPAYDTIGYYGPGVNKGSVDNNLYSGQFNYAVGPHTFGAGYQRSTGQSDTVWVNQGDGSSTYFMTESQIAKFQHSGERTYQLRYAYDFAAQNLPGLTFSAMYQNGDHIRSDDGDRKEWERDLTLNYVVQSGTLKGLSFSYRFGSLRSSYTGQRDMDENRFIVNYLLPVL
ncbi:OprD family porin [Pseudomonas sp. TH31]|uniref:OprD family porin n=1 Tax=Pseudomonas sp. TH31 TaxID=2796396 RepID=UPI00191188B1|nr:OprD family porin [Pseudomonas sp. TH31]MBK5416203.1 OprD family porin [Pseudomonas sp. TH31]